VIKSFIAYLPMMKKALVPVAIGLILKGLALAGITGDMTVEQAVGYGVTAFFVWLVANSKVWFTKA